MLVFFTPTDCVSCVDARVENWRLWSDWEGSQVGREGACSYVCVFNQLFPSPSPTAFFPLPERTWPNVCVCVHACVCACVCVCMRVCVCTAGWMLSFKLFNILIVMDVVDVWIVYNESFDTLASSAIIMAASWKVRLWVWLHYPNSAVTLQFIACWNMLELAPKDWLTLHHRLIS